MVKLCTKCVLIFLKFLKSGDKNFCINFANTHTHKRGTSFAFFTRWKTGWVQARKLERQFIYKKLLLKFKINRLGCYANLVYLVK